MAHEILVEPYVAIEGVDLSDHVRACSLPMTTRDAVDATVGTDTAKSFLLTRPTGTWQVRLAADFDAGAVDAVLRPTVPPAAFEREALHCRVRRNGREPVGADNLEYRFAAVMPGYAGFDEVDLDALLEVTLNFQITPPQTAFVAVWGPMPTGPGSAPDTPVLSSPGQTPGAGGTPGVPGRDVGLGTALDFDWTFREGPSHSPRRTQLTPAAIRAVQVRYRVNGAGDYFYWVGGAEFSADPSRVGAESVHYQPDGGWGVLRAGQTGTNGTDVRFAGNAWNGNVGDDQEWQVRTFDADLFASEWSNVIEISAS